MKRVAKVYLMVLELIASRLSKGDVMWAVTGSLGFALQGVPVQPHDIDIQTDAQGAYEIERLLLEYLTEKVHFAQSSRIRSHFGAFEIDGIRVEVMGDIQKRYDNGTWSAPPDLKRHIHYLEIDEMTIPVLSLAYECQAYRQLGRDDKADLLRRWLRQHGSSATGAKGE